MKPGCMFLRIGSVLLKSLNLPVEDACDGWVVLRSNGIHLGRLFSNLPEAQLIRTAR